MNNPTDHRKHSSKADMAESADSLFDKMLLASGRLVSCNPLFYKYTHMYNMMTQTLKIYVFLCFYLC